MGTKIQINSLQALERLIGGDSEVEIEIRNSVVQEYAKQHLKVLAQNFVFQDLNIIKNTVKEEVRKAIGVESWNNFKLSNQATLEIEKAVNAALNKKVNSAIQDAVKVINVEEFVDKQITKRLEAISSQEIDRAIRQKIKEIIEKVNVL